MLTPLRQTLITTLTSVIESLKQRAKTADDQANIAKLEAILQSLKDGAT